jgi:hypothetical protein
MAKSKSKKVKPTGRDNRKQRGRRPRNGDRPRNGARAKSIDLIYSQNVDGIFESKNSSSKRSYAKLDENDWIKERNYRRTRPSAEEPRETFSGVILAFRRAILY